MFALSICLFLSGEMAKQMKVKKLKNLKTLDSKPGKYFILLIILSCEVPYKTAAHSRTQIYVYEGADFPPEGAVQSLSCVFLHLCIVCVCVAGVYTAYKPYLNKDEEIIKQLQKVRPPCPAHDLTSLLNDCSRALQSF